MREVLCSHIRNVEHSALPGWPYTSFARSDAFLHRASEWASPVVTLLFMLVLHPLYIVREGPVATSFELGRYTLNLLDCERKDRNLRSEPLHVEVLPSGLLSLSWTNIRSRDIVCHEIFQSYFFCGFVCSSRRSKIPRATRGGVHPRSIRAGGYRRGR